MACEGKPVSEDTKGYVLTWELVAAAEVPSESAFLVLLCVARETPVLASQRPEYFWESGVEQSFRVPSKTERTACSATPVVCGRPGVACAWFHPSACAAEINLGALSL